MAYHWIAIWVARRGNEMVFAGVRAAQSLVFLLQFWYLQTFPSGICRHSL